MKMNTTYFKFNSHPPSDMSYMLYANNITNILFLIIWLLLPHKKRTQTELVKIPGFLLTPIKEKIGKF